jgi:hypothetical protein
VAYRDHCDGDKIEEVLPFTNDIAKCQRFIAQLEAMGGGDGPEDLAGGFENALKQQWKSKSKYAILLADAPCHGTKYHDDSYDNYKGGDPKGRLVENQIRKFAERGIYFSCVKMTSYTDKMHKILNENYKAVMANGLGITFADLGHSTSSLNFFVTSSVTHSLTLS